MQRIYLTAAMFALLTLTSSAVASPKIEGGKPDSNEPGKTHKNYSGLGINPRWYGPLLLPSQCAPY